jgi:hypothetical protein
MRRRPCLISTKSTPALLGGRSHTAAPADEQRLTFTDIDRIKKLRDEGTALTASSAIAQQSSRSSARARDAY